METQIYTPKEFPELFNLKSLSKQAVDYHIKLYDGYIKNSTKFRMNTKQSISTQQITTTHTTVPCLLKKHTTTTPLFSMKCFSKTSSQNRLNLNAG